MFLRSGRSAAAHSEPAVAAAAAASSGRQTLGERGVGKLPHARKALQLLGRVGEGVVACERR